MNSIRTLLPYKYYGQWVFDDPALGLVREAFVGGTDKIIDHLVVSLKQPEKGFLLIFSDRPFPDATIVLHWVGEECDGNVYQLEGTEMKGWLCPSLLKYFDKPPKEIHVCLRSSE